MDFGLDWTMIRQPRRVKWSFSLLLLLLLLLLVLWLGTVLFEAKYNLAPCFTTL